MPRVRCHRRGKQNPPASVAQTETPRNSSRLENSPGIRSEIVPLPLGAPRARRRWLAATPLYIIWGSLGQRDKPREDGQIAFVPVDDILDIQTTIAAIQTQ